MPLPLRATLFARVLWLAWPAAGPTAETLRLCADPDNLPFSHAGGGERGLYVELAELVAARMGARAEHVWWPSDFGKRAVRNTLLSDRCDAYFGLPHGGGFMGQSVTVTRPFLEVGYAVIAPAGLPLSSLADLRGRRVGVQFASYPQLLLSAREGYELVTFRLADEVLEALARREVDAAFLWGPLGGYHNKTKLGGAYRVVPVTGPGLQWQAAVGVRRGREDLRMAIDRALGELAPEIARLAEKYGLPAGPSIDSGPDGDGRRAPPP